MTASPMRSDVRCYSYSVLCPSGDDEFVATVAEFPALSWLHVDQDSALAGLRDLVAEVVDDLSAQGEPVPIFPGEHRFSESSASARLRTCIEP